MVPYIIIVLFNNLLIYKVGFYKIGDDALLMLTCAFVIFFLGTLPFKFKIHQFSDNHNECVLKSYNIKAIRIFLYLVGILGLLQALLYFKNGMLLSADSDTEGVMGNGPIGHLLLSSYSVLPIYFLYWTYNKKFIDLLPVVLVLLVAFSSFIKYNVIGPIIIIFIFVCLYRKSLLKKAFIAFSLFILIFFIANYAIGFAIVGAEVDPQFYIGHFWKYFAGSIIHDNYIFTTGINNGISLFYKLMTFLCALPNMFFSKLLGKTYFDFPETKMDPISDFGEDTNVTELFGYLYPSHGDFGDILSFAILIFISGLIISYIYTKCLRNTNKYSSSVAIFLTYFIALDFFSPFFVLPGPWEILIWSMIIPSFFKNKRRIRHEVN